ncbi:linoleate diol synthase [Ophiocordyceps sinensis CO18]|uniref:linoleate 8R-lipoxygenase n=1 Tax=Ophiocordyceps sinensis (strain Co18 / CGMCC 3.14243) TaxID=911162 RepID=T5AC53_OPHSC|nr:linoleate diol synthase [Ophiocordyceps sinensis CO18]
MPSGVFHTDKTTTMSFDEKFQLGEAYADEPVGSSQYVADPLKIAADVLKDCDGLRGKVSVTEISDLIKGLLNKGAPIDDKKGTTEFLIGILTSLPSTSKVRTFLTNKLIDSLWNNLQHPPLCYVGGDVKYEVVSGSKAAAEPDPDDTIQFTVPDSDVVLRESVPQAPDGLHQYRTPDGSFNNILQPDLGRAGTPYAKTVGSTKRLQGVKPDPGLLFDLLMARDDDHFKENQAGLSSMFLYHASIIIHDIFNTHRTDPNKSDTSSYLDLAPLYGSSLRDQLEVRTMKEGKLKPDTFHEKRLLGQPAGVNVMLVLYSRFHNYVCDVLLKINENGRFTLACGPNADKKDRAVAVAKQDHHLFNTARLVVGGLYINISLHDYLRAITNTHHSNSDWTLDPRVDINKQFDGEGAPRGVGNQVSVEFNLLYRFHACISKKDERWINDFFLKLFPGRKAEDLKDVSWSDLGAALVDFEAKTPKPSARTFGGLVRQADGTFKDEDLVRILDEAMKDPAGTFGPRTVPKALKMVEVLGIIQARKWQVASLNEFRQFFGLKRHETFGDISSNPDIAKLLEKLYTDPDMVELYPGLVIEDAKPVRNAGSGCPTYTVGRAVLSDAITLVRADRFNTLDYTVSNLTSWGYNEVQHDNKTLGGSMMYKLIQRGLPGWFAFNSLAVMQPMFTKKVNEEIARELGTMDQYTLDDPKPPPKPVVVFTSAAIKQALGSPKQFAVPWLQAVNSLFPGKKVIGILTSLPSTSKVRTFLTNKLIDSLWNNLQHPPLCYVGGDVKYEVVSGSKAAAEPDPDDTIQFTVPDSDVVLRESVPQAPDGLHVRVARAGTRANRRNRGNRRNRRPRLDFRLFGIVSAISDLRSREKHIKEDSLRSCGLKMVEELLDMGNSAEKVVDNLWLTAFGGIGAPVTSFYEVVEFFLRAENAAIWAQVQSLAEKGDTNTLHSYVVEAQRLTSSQRNVRIATQPTELEGKPIQPGNLVVMMLGEAGRNPAEVADATKFDPLRKTEAVTTFSYGLHECVGKDLALAFVTGLVKLVAGLKKLRPAPGQMGLVKTIRLGSEKAYLNDSWSYLGFDASTWKVHFDGRGKGNFQGDREPTKPMALQQYYHLLQKRKEEILG